MKMKRTLVLLLAMLPASVLGQHINNTLGDGGIFTIKDGTPTTFLTLSQSDGYLSLNKSLTLPATTSSTLGVIFKGSDRFIHDFKASGTMGNNTFVGVNAGSFALTGTSGYQSSYNTAVGYSSLASLTSGSGNSAFGMYSLWFNQDGKDNSAFGYAALASNTSGNENSAFGKQSLGNNESGNSNSAFGYFAMLQNTSGSSNCAFGREVLYSNGDGNWNSALGQFALYSSTSGDFNSAFGYGALYASTGDANTAFGYGCGNSITSGSYNTCLGYAAGFNIDKGSNNICIGNYATPPYPDSSNQIRMGNGSITYAGIQVAWSVVSDRRWKSNITPSNLGLAFVSQLNPVSYTRKNDGGQRIEYGFIAQEIEGILNEAGVKNAGMITVDDEGSYELRYNDLLAPMVKAIQELKAQNESLRNQLLALRASVAQQVKNEVRAVLLKAGSEETTQKVTLNEAKD